MKANTTIAIVTLLIMLAACGKKDSGSSNGITNPGAAEGQETTTPPMEPQKLAGQYQSFLRPLNTAVSGFIPSGKANFVVTEEGKFSARTYLEDDSRVVHIQGIYEGTQCPTLADDANGDGFIDVIEMRKSTGKLLVPLDGDLNTQAGGQNAYPVGKAFTYEKTGDAEAILTDLYTKDLAASSHMSKLPEGAPLNLAGRVVVVHGTADLSRVPETVQTLEGQSRNVTIPITCGVIQRL